MTGIVWCEQLISLRNYRQNTSRIDRSDGIGINTAPVLEFGVNSFPEAAVWLVLPPFRKGWHGFELEVVHNRANLYETEGIVTIIWVQHESWNYPKTLSIAEDFILWESYCAKCSLEIRASRVFFSFLNTEVEVALNPKFMVSVLFNSNKSCLDWDHVFRFNSDVITWWSLVNMLPIQCYLFMCWLLFSAGYKEVQYMTWKDQSKITISSKGS